MDMTTPPRTIAVILAGGSGERFGGNVPKQFTKLAGKLVIEHTVEIFQRHEQVDEIIVVARAADVDTVWNLARRAAWHKVSKVVCGGADRFGSTQSAVQALAAAHGATRVLLHDAVRPLLAAPVIAACVEALRTFDAVDVVIPSSDTLVVVNDNGCIASIPPRATMRRGQTPQGFRLATLRDAYARATKAGKRSFTCDCGVVRAMLPQVEVATVEGSETNIKITNQLDLFLAEKLIQCGGIQFDDAPESAGALDALQGKRIAIFGGSSGIGRAIHDLALLNGASVHVASRSSNGVDVGDLASVQAWLQAIAAEGPIDAVINTAGILIKKPFESMAAEELTRIVGTNYAGAVNVAFAARAHLARSRGALLNFTSSSYTRGRAFYAVYSSTKSAVVNLTQALAEEWQDEGVRVNCINPERTRTPMRTEAFGAEPAGTLLEPATVAFSALSTVLSSHTGLIVDVRSPRAPMAA
jgi:2-C-methyl-D-erythritol 4-phosphate cytidylyltransferase